MSLSKGPGFFLQLEEVISRKTDVVCSGCGFPIRDSFCGPKCTGRFDGVEVEIQEPKK